MEPTETRSWKAGPPGTGVGVLYDLGPHLIDQAVQLLGPVRDVYAEMRTRREGSGADDDTFLALQHERGAVSHLWMSAVAPQAGPRFRVLGSRAGFTSFGLDPVAAHVAAGAGPATDDVEPGEAQVGVGEDQRRVPLRRGDYGAFYRAVARAVTGGSAPPVDARDSVAVIELIERVHREFGEP